MHVPGVGSFDASPDGFWIARDGASTSQPLIQQLLNYVAASTLPMSPPVSARDLESFALICAELAHSPPSEEKRTVALYRLAVDLWLGSRRAGLKP